MINFLNKHCRLILAFFVFYIIFLLFFGLDLRSLRLWDESRLAVNAAEMLINKNFWYTTYHNTPDFWNTKPHFLILLQVLSMKLFGLNEGSVRFPSALATLFTAGILYHWVKSEKYSYFFAGLAVSVFLCNRFLIFHGARAGDYDALLIMFELLYCYTFTNIFKIHVLNF